MTVKANPPDRVSFAIRGRVNAVPQTLVVHVHRFSDGTRAIELEAPPEGGRVQLELDVTTACQLLKALGGD